MNPPPAPAGPNRFATGTWLFLRALAVVHALAFISLWTQIDGLIGPNGILPAASFLTAVRDHFGSTVAAFAQLPTLCWWLGANPTTLHILCAIGLLSSVLLFVGLAPAFNLAVLWLAYLSLCGVGQTFFNFQWDALLLETTFLAIFIAPWSLCPLFRRTAPPSIAHWLLIWLLFRLMFLSGAVKLASGDPTWAKLTALAVHYETQPLPTPLAWYAHQLPLWFHRASCALMFVIELAVPFLFFAPWRRLRHTAALATIALMLIIALTGNYTFFNLLTATLCLPLLDDKFWSRLASRVARGRALRSSVPLSAVGPHPRSAAPSSPRRPLAAALLQNFAHLPRLWRGWRNSISDSETPNPTPLQPSVPRTAPRWLLLPLAACILIITTLQAGPSFIHRWQLSDRANTVLATLAPFRTLNNYGLFRVMTTTRAEIVIEGSNDGRTWLAYEFRHKPGDLARRSTWVAPHQPRLDWQMWFAALGRLEHNRWVLSLCEHLLKNTPAVTDLLAVNPFAASPPAHLRAVRYEYHFTTPDSRAETGRYWRRTPIDYYLTPTGLRQP